MLIILSPAKKINTNIKNAKFETSETVFLKESKELVSVLKKYKPQDLSSLMSISPKLSELNYERYLKWTYPFKGNDAGIALLMFQGDVYQGLKAEDYTEEDMDFAQDHLRILSGLYGILRPKDNILPYRLEMGTKLKTKRGKDLYEFWGNKIHNKIKEDIKNQGDNILINLASNEYFKSVRPKSLKTSIITPEFKEYKDGTFKMISFYAKKARGLMSRYIIKNKLIKAEDLKGFNEEKYAFNEKLSTQEKLVFTR